MVDFETIHHFIFTVQALQRQTFQSFELIIADYLYDTRRNEFDWNLLGNCRFKVYHIPITHSWAKNNGYCAISGTKNAGIMLASGKYLLFLDDCSTFEARFLEKIYSIWQQTHTFANALHLKNKGPGPLLNSEGKPIRDCRFQVLDDIKTDVLINGSDLYGYASMSLDAALKVNGYSEDYDASRNLEDVDMGHRLMAAGYKISIHRNLVVIEQQHHAISPHNVSKVEGYDPKQKDTGFQFKESLHCNGPFLFMKRERRTGEDYYKANHRQYTPEEKALMKPCYKLTFIDGVARCIGSNRGCNWVNPDGKTKHMIHPDSDIWLNNLPVFSLANERQSRLYSKEQYRVR